MLARRTVFIVLTMSYVSNVIAEAGRFGPNKYAANRKKATMIREFKSCPNVKSGVKLLSSSVDMAPGGTTVVNAEFEMLKNIAGANKIVVVAYKCPSYAEHDSCEFFMRVPFSTNYCTRLNDSNQLYTPILRAIRPPFRSCPLKKGLYTVTNVTLDVHKIEEIVADVPIIYTHYWMFEVRLYYGKYVIFCGIGGGEIVTIRSRK